MEQERREKGKGTDERVLKVKKEEKWEGERRKEEGGRRKGEGETEYNE